MPRQGPGGAHLKAPRYYTTEVSEGRTIDQIYHLLAEVGASQYAVIKDVKRGKVGVSFIWNEQKIQFALDINRIYETLQPKKRRSVPSSKRTIEQACRIAFRLLANFLDNHIELVRWGIATPAEAFLPYLVLPNGETLIERMLTENGKLQLPEPKD